MRDLDLRDCPRFVQDRAFDKGFPMRPDNHLHTFRLDYDVLTRGERIECSKKCGTFVSASPRSYHSSVELN